MWSEISSNILRIRVGFTSLHLSGGPDSSDPCREIQQRVKKGKVREKSKAVYSKRLGLNIICSFGVFLLPAACSISDNEEAAAARAGILTKRLKGSSCSKMTIESKIWRHEVPKSCNSKPILYTEQPTLRTQTPSASRSRSWKQTAAEAIFNKPLERHLVPLKYQRALFHVNCAAEMRQGHFQGRTNSTQRS